MRLKKLYILLNFILLSLSTAYGKSISSERASAFCAEDSVVRIDTLENRIRFNKRHEDIEVHFRFDKSELDLNYMDNGVSLQKFKEMVSTIGAKNIDSILVVSKSSPEGAYEYNIKLSKRRAGTMRKYISENFPEIQQRILVHPDGESWKELRELVLKDSLMKNSTIEKVVSIIDSDINIATKKWRLKQLPIYRYLITTYYPRIRNSSFYIIYYHEEEISSPKEEVCDTVITDTIAPPPVEEIVEVVPDTIIAPPAPPKAWNQRLYLKTNTIGLGMGIANVAAEIDIAKHWSFSLPVYYSGWNYLKSTIKIRTLALQPEVRYWLSENNVGFFTGAHFTWMQYNFAFNNDYRYQDHNGKSPALGGGLNVGYRLPFRKNNNWQVEFSLGAGVYSLHYDKFYNTDHTTQGLKVNTLKKTYFGIDQAAITLSYSFDLKKKGGKR